MSPKFRSIASDVVVSLCIFTLHIFSHYQYGLGPSFIVTAILSMIVGYVRSSVSLASAFPQWLLVNCWFFVYIAGLFTFPSHSLVFLMASYGASALGFLSFEMEFRIDRKYVFLIMGLLAVGLFLIGRYLIMPAYPYTPPVSP